MDALGLQAVELEPILSVEDRVLQQNVLLRKNVWKSSGFRPKGEDSSKSDSHRTPSESWTTCPRPVPTYYRSPGRDPKP